MPIELANKALCSWNNLNLNWDEASKERVSQLHEMEEFYLRAYKSSNLYKERMQRWHDDKILKRECREGDSILLYN